jgi:hypothetical protein
MKNIDNGKNTTSSIVRPTTQMILICISLSIIAYTAYIKINQYNIYDPEKPIIQVTPEIYAKLGATPELVTVGLRINQFKKFNMITSKFEFNGIIWFEFNQYAVDLESLGKFVFEEGVIDYKSSPDVHIKEDRIMVRYNISATVSSPFNYVHFPFDNHRLNIIVANYFVSPSTVIFQTTDPNFIVDQNPKEHGWQLFNKTVSAGFEKSELDPHDPTKTAFYPLAIFSLDYTQYGIRYLLSIMLPLLLLFYLSLFSFSRPSEEELDLSLGGVTGILGYRFVIESFSPNPGYFILADYLFFLFLGASAAIFIFNVFDKYVPALGRKRRFIALLLIHTIVAGSCVYLFLS